MGSHMNDKLARLNEGFATLGALMRSLACMNSHVAVQFAAMFESASAMRTTVRFLLGVDSTVDAQVFLDGKRFSAHFAHKWALT